MVTQDISSSGQPAAPAALDAAEPDRDSYLTSPADSGDEHQSTIGSLPPPRLRLDLQRARGQARLSEGEASAPASAGSGSVFSGSFGDVVRGAALRTPSVSVLGDEPAAAGAGDEVVVDGGYGWFVAFGAFFANVCTSGTIKSFGLISLQMVELFNVSAAETAVITGILLTTGLIISPVVGAFCQRYTCRHVATFGGLMCFLGFSLSSLATNITQLCLTIGLLAGVGAGCVSTPAILVATRYFPTRRSLINGIVLAGNAAGGFAMPPLFQFFLALYGLRGTLLLIGAVCLNVVAGAALFRPVALQEKLLRRQRRRQRRQQQQRQQQQVAERQPLAPAGGELAVESTEKKSSLPTERWTGERRLSGLSVKPAAAAAAGAASRQRTTSESLWREPERRRSSSLRPPAADGLARRGTVADSRPRLVEVSRRNSCGQAVTLLVELPPRLRTSSLMLSAADVTTDATTQLDDDLRRLQEGADGGGGGCAPRSLRRLRAALSLHLLGNPLFALEAASVFLMAAGAPFALLQLPAFGVSRGLTPDQAAHMLSIASAVDLASRLGFGWLFDQGLFQRQYALIASQLLSGGMVLALPFCYDYASILSLSLIFSIGIGTWFINLAPVLADNHGIENIAASYGLVRMFHGLSTLVMPPIFGAIVDSTGDHGDQFFAIGSSMALGGVLILIVVITGIDKKYGIQEDAPDEKAEKSSASTKESPQKKQAKKKAVSDDAPRTEKITENV